MNLIDATILKIRAFDGVSLVEFETASQNLKMMSLDLDKSLQEGCRVILGVKASNISLALSVNDTLSISNQLHCRVHQLKVGELLASVKLEFNGAILESIITKDSALKMQIKEGDMLIGLIKSSELSILELV